MQAFFTAALVCSHVLSVKISVFNCFEIFVNLFHSLNPPRSSEYSHVASTHVSSLLTLMRSCSSDTEEFLRTFRYTKKYNTISVHAHMSHIHRSMIHKACVHTRPGRRNWVWILLGLSFKDFRGNYLTQHVIVLDTCLADL